MMGSDCSQNELVGADKSGVDWSGADLSGMNLTGIDLSGATLAGADLSKANFTGANLSGADLSEAEIVGANFTTANIVGADLSEATIRWAYFVDVRGAGVDLSAASIDRANFTDSNLGAGDLSGVDCYNPNFYNVQLGGADLSNATLEGNFQSVDFQRADLVDATLKCNVRDADLYYTDCSGIDIQFDSTDLGTAATLEGSIIPEEYDPREMELRSSAPIHTVDVGVGPVSKSAASNHDHETGSKATEMLIVSDCASESSIAGCAEEEIRHIERACDVELPASYRSMLKHIGRNCGRFMEGTAFCYERKTDMVPDLIHRGRIARRNAQREGDSISFDDKFVLVSHQGYSYIYFHTDTDDPDPPVFSYVCGDTVGEKYSDSFSEWLFDAIEHEC